MNSVGLWVWWKKRDAANTEDGQWLERNLVRSVEIFKSLFKRGENPRERDGVPKLRNVSSAKNMLNLRD